jgi:hypothetical protein
LAQKAALVLSYSFNERVLQVLARLNSTFVPAPPFAGLKPLKTQLSGA